MVDERSLKFTDSYLTSTISTTSGLGSNYTTNTSGSSLTQPTTPSPRRQTSSSTFIEVADIPENEIEENITQYFTPLSPNFSDYRTQNQPQTSHYFNRMQSYGNPSGQGNNGYFSKYIRVELICFGESMLLTLVRMCFVSLLIFYALSRFQLFPISARN